LPDAKNADVELQPEGKLTFSATVGSQDTPFELNLELYDKVNVEVCIYSLFHLGDSFLD
jgi:prostaglandin-E synthase